VCKANYTKLVKSQISIYNIFEMFRSLVFIFLFIKKKKKAQMRENLKYYLEKEEI
jgi:hypothetical protein